jgi:hypothetical protein
MPFRYPKGTWLKGKAVGGQFAALTDLPWVAAVVTRLEFEALLRMLSRDERRARKRLDEALDSERRAEDSPRFAKRHAARKAAEESARSLVATRDAVYQSRFPPPSKAPLKRRRPEPEEPGDEAEEWAIGASYSPEVGGNHTSAVDVSILVRRVDGSKMPQREAAAVMRYVREHRIVPVEYYLAAIDWRSPKSKNGKAKKFKGWQTGNVATDFENFYNILTAISKHKDKWELKMGGLK